MNKQPERWKGRHSKKDQLRAKVWQALEENGAAVGSPWSKIPNFKGADEAAQQLQNIPEWKAANVVKCNPDAAQAPIRLMALSQGKRVYTPVPELVESFPFLLLDPVTLKEAGIPFTDVMYAEGAQKHGIRCEFSDMQAIDFAVVGCVAVTKAGGRTGKGAGFADLEMGIFRYFDTLKNSIPIVTTVHSLQIVSDSEVVMEAHDTPLDWIASPEGLTRTNTQYPTPGPIDWDALRPDQYQSIPFLSQLRTNLDPSKGESG